MATDRLSFFSIATVFTLAIAAAPAWAQQRDFTVPSGSLHSLQPEMIRQNDPGFLVRADVNRASRSYRDGDTLSITVASEADAYLYVLYKQADGKVFQIFPNSVQSQNRVRARQAVQIPDSDDTFRWVIGPPFGTEYVKVIASKEPLEGMSDPAMRAKFFNPVSGRNIKGIEARIGQEENGLGGGLLRDHDLRRRQQRGRLGRTPLCALHRPRRVCVSSSRGRRAERGEDATSFGFLSRPS